ncbi:MAG: SUF system Fe-S cluster assembly protein [Alphaproteobacteria bacterium]|nr:SUF system Fe-S cluster assembly protein [Alphaproteobacteria bacterium]
MPAEALDIASENDGWDDQQAVPTGNMSSAIPQDELNRLTDDMITAIKSVYDPEIPVDIYELGLIYKIDVDDDRKVDIDMTLTAPGCPVAGEMPGWVEDAVSTVQGVQDVKVNLVFDPPWDITRMSDEAKIVLNMW